MVDFHTHILPGIDDGSRSLKESLEMLRTISAQGIRYVVATPHFNARRDTPEAFLDRRNRAEIRLRRAMAQEPGLPKLTVGAEVAYFRGISEWEALPELTIRGTKYLLIEMPTAPWTEAMYAELEAIRKNRGITPVIAHVDRYIRPLFTHGIPKRLAQLPVLVQANAEFFLTPGTSGMALRMLKGEQIHLLGSDCHNMADRKPNLGDALTLIREKLGPGALRKIQKQEKQIWSGK